MAKIHHNIPSIDSPCTCSTSSERETFTVWMKSLVFNGKGCTVFDSKGDVVYRVDNYQKACGSEAVLMDSSGTVLFSIESKKFRFLWCQEGFKWDGNQKVINRERPWFKVRRDRAILGKNTSCRVDLTRNESTGNAGYKIEGSDSEGKSAFKITDFSGQLLAEAVSKTSSEGVPLGEDVLTLTVEPNVDRSLVMSLVIVYGLINKKL